MLQIQGRNGLEPLSEVNGLLQKPQNKGVGGFSSTTSGKKSKEAAILHALAEKGRRKRINQHLETLRQHFPELAKKQKASVLMEVVQRLRELRRKVADQVALEEDEEGCCNGGRSLFLPGEKDKVEVIGYCEGERGGERMVKATICCEDRQRLNADLAEAVRSVKGRLVKAEMATIGGRTKVVLLVQLSKEGGGGREEEVGSLRMALKAVAEDRALSSSMFSGSSLLSSRWANLSHKLATASGSVSHGRPILGDLNLKSI